MILKILISAQMWMEISTTYSLLRSHVLSLELGTPHISYNDYVAIKYS